MDIGIGLYALLVPVLLVALQSLYLWVTPLIGITGIIPDVTRSVLALLLLLVPTFLMGGTLPMLIRGLTDRLDSLGGNTARLYGLNTFGAAMGAFSAGYFLIPNLGVRASTGVAVLFNLVAGVVVFLFANRWQTSVAPISDQSESNPNENLSRNPILTPFESKILLAGFAFSGFAALQFQTAWIKAMLLMVGSSVYAFSATLTVFLAGIAIGSFIAIRITTRYFDRRLLRLAVIIQFLLSLSALGSMVLIGEIPEMLIKGYESGLVKEFRIYQLYQFGLCFLVMLVPTIFMGILFPVVVSLWTRSALVLGHGVGLAYACNTFGTILGALLGGVFILPFLGIQNSVVFASGISVMVAASYWFMVWKGKSSGSRIFVLILSPAIFALIVFMMPAWNKLVMQSGPYIYADSLAGFTKKEGLESFLRKRTDLLFYEEGINGVISVTQRNDQRSLAVNGKIDASSKSDMPTQVMLGQVPMMIHPDPEDVLVLGLGSGATAGAIASHQNLENLDLVEISPEVIAATKFFQEVNNNVLADPKVNVIHADGRNYITSTSNKYDVIVSEPSNPWLSGVSNLFTREFFQAARDRLKNGGLLAQWFHFYSMSNEDLKSVLGTFTDEFKYVQIWLPMSTDLILIGSSSPIGLDDHLMRNRFRNPEVSNSLKQGGVTHIAEFVNQFFLNDSQARALGIGSIRNTDDHPKIEFSAPKYLHQNTSYKNINFLFFNEKEHRNTIEAVKMVMPAGNNWEVLAAGLNLVSTSNTTKPQATWRVAYKWLKNNEAAVIKIFVYLHWKDDVSRYQLISGIRTQQGNDVQTRNILDQYLTNGISERGSITLRGKVPGFWATGPSGNSGMSQIGIAWECNVSTDWGYQYLVRRYLKDFGEELDKVLVELAEQVSCIDHISASPGEPATSQ